MPSGPLAGSEAVLDVLRLTPRRMSVVRPARRLVSIAKMPQRISFETEVSYLPAQVDTALVTANALVVLAKPAPGIPEAVPGARKRSAWPAA